MFRTCSNKGFQMTFANGWTASVQWGPGNYCEKRSNLPREWDAPSKSESWESKDAEVAAWNKDNQWYDFGSDTVEGWKSCDDVARFLLNVSQLPEQLPKGQLGQGELALEE